jgi:MFS family permease
MEATVSSAESGRPWDTRRGRPAERLFHGWYIAAASLVIMTFGIGGGLYLFGVLLPPLLAEFGWTHAELSGANSAAMIVMGLLGPAVGRAIDRYGPRTLMSASAVCCGVGFAGQALVGSQPALNRLATPLTQLYGCYALYGAGLAGIGYVPVNTIVSRWFTRRRGLALGTVAIGTGLGGLLTVPAGWLIDRLGWRAASAIIGIAIITIVLPLVALVIRLGPEEMGLLPDGRPPDDTLPPVKSRDQRTAGHAPPVAVLTSATFWAMSVAFGVYTVTVTVVRVFGIALLQEKGFPAPDARFVMGGLALWGIVGKVGFGALTDRMPARLVTTGAFVLEAIGTLFLLGPATALSAALFSVIYGLPMGGIATLEPVLVARHFAPASFGTVYGTLVLLLTFCAAAGPVVAGRVYDLRGGYQPTLIACAIASGAAAALMLLMPGSSAPAESGVAPLRS